MLLLNQPRFNCITKGFAPFAAVVILSFFRSFFSCTIYSWMKTARPLVSCDADGSAQPLFSYLVSITRFSSSDDIRLQCHSFRTIKAFLTTVLCQRWDSLTAPCGQLLPNSAGSFSRYLKWAFTTYETFTTRHLIARYYTTHAIDINLWTWDMTSCGCAHIPPVFRMIQHRKNLLS